MSVRGWLPRRHAWRGCFMCAPSPADGGWGRNEGYPGNVTHTDGTGFPVADDAKSPCITD